MRPRATAKRLLGPQWTTRLRCLTRGMDLPRWGNLRRTSPFSANYGFDRGTPVDRHYLHAFLAAHADWITGDVLEIQGCGYTERFGRRVRTAHSVDIDPRFRPTFVCDLALSDGILPSARYDCFLMPNTLQHLRDLDGSLHHALRVIRPGGAILASAAGFLPLIPDGPDYWRLSAQGWQEVLQRAWPSCTVGIEAHGNALAAVAAMLGLAGEELSEAELDARDPRYPVLVTVACRKPERDA